MASATQTLERRIEQDPDDATAHFRLAVLLLASRDLYEFYTPDENGVVARAEALLARAVTLRPGHAMSHAALGFARHQLDRPADALSCFLTARKLDPRNETIDVYVPTLLVELEREQEALAELARVARRRKVSLAKLRRELAAVNFEADADNLLRNGFIRARNYLWSWIATEAERVRNALRRGRKEQMASREVDDCKARSRKLQRQFHASRVPAALRPLAAPASRYGIGDDVCRALLMKRIPKATRSRLIEKADRLAVMVDAWLDTFPRSGMSVEAAAFMYLMEGVEEIR